MPTQGVVSKCLDERVVHDLLAGALDPATAATAHGHIDECESCRDIVALAATDAPARPDTIGRYQIERVAGSGAMGIVYEAVDPQLGRRVAIKLLRNQRGRDADRLLREARAVAQISHPNVIAVHDSGIADGEVFMVMELIRGVTLREWLAERARTPSEIIRVVLQAGRGLAAVHAAGLVHRDVKPDNILVAADGRILLTDFGLVHLDRGATTSLGDAIDLTQTGAVVGTPVYLAPEILDGADASVLSDQFSYCVALHEALAGTRPFLGATLPELRAAIDRGPAPLAAKGVPDAIGGAIARGLAVSPPARWPSLDALLAELELRLRARTRRTWIAGGAVALAVAGVSGGLAVRALSSSSDGPSCDAGDDELAGVWNPQVRERIGAAFARSKLPYATSTWGALAATLDSYAKRWATSFDAACTAAHVKRTQSIATFDLRSRCLERRRGELAATLDVLANADAAQVARASAPIAALVSPAVCDDATTLAEVVAVPDTADVRAKVTAAQQELARATASHKAGQYKPALKQARTVVATADAIGYPPLIAEAHFERALIAIDLEQWPEAKQSLNTALLAAERGRDHRTRANVHLRLAVLALQHEDQKSALAELDRGDAIVAGLGGATRERALLADVRGMALGDMGKLPEAVAALEQASRLYVEVEGPASIALTSPVTKLGYIAYQRGDLAGAVKELERVLAIKRAALGPDHPELGAAYTDLAFVLRDGRRLDEALTAADAARTTFARSLGEDSAEYWEATRALVGIHRRRGAHADAEAIARQVLAAMDKLGPKDQRTADALDDLAQTLTTAQQKLDEAVTLRRRSLDIRLATHDDPNHTSVLMATAALADATADVHRYRDALPIYEKAQALADQPDRPPYLAPTTRNGRGRCLLALGRHREAVPLFEQAIALADPAKMDPRVRVTARLGLAMARFGSGDRKAAQAAAEAAKQEATAIEDPELLAAANEWLAKPYAVR